MTPVSALPLDTLDGDTINALRDLTTDSESELREIIQMYGETTLEEAMRDDVSRGQGPG